MAAYKGIVQDIIKETPNIKLFRIKLDKPINYLSGQFVMISLDNVKNQSGFPLKRSYSIASEPVNKDYLELCIKILEEGQLTHSLNQLKKGDSVNVDGPFGKFLMEEPKGGSNKIIFIGTGAGIAPLISMIGHSLKKSKKEMILIYGFRNPEDFCYKKELNDLAGKYPYFKLYPTISAKIVPKRWNLDTGRVTSIIPKYVKSNETESVYICGNPQMVLDTIACLKSIGIDEKIIHKEQW